MIQSKYLSCPFCINIDGTFFKLEMKTEIQTGHHLVQASDNGYIKKSVYNFLQTILYINKEIMSIFFLC